MISEVCHQNNILRFAKVKTRVDVEKVIYQHKVDYIVVRMSSEHEKQERFATVFWQLLGTIWGNMDKNCKIVEYDYEIHTKNQ